MIRFAMICFAWVLIFATLCSGCGLKGPLYMPEKSSAPVVITPEAQSLSSASSAAPTTP